MIPVFRTLAGVCGALALSMATGAAAQEKQVYRYTDKDGNVVYTDRVPPGDSKDVQAKRLGANYIETNELPLAAQQAMARYPVTLYTFACGELCLNAEGLLNRRGVPFSTVNVEEPKNAERLKALTGDNQALGTVRGVDHDVDEARGAQRLDLPDDQRLVPHRQQGLGAGVGQRPHALAAAGRQDHRAEGHSLPGVQDATPTAGARSSSSSSSRASGASAR